MNSLPSSYFRSHPEMAIMMEGILRLYGLLFGLPRDMDLDDEGDFVDMVEGNLEEDMELVHEENMRRLASDQEQVRVRREGRRGGGGGGEGEEEGGGCYVNSY